MKNKLFHNKKFLGTGLLVTLLCCFTPLLVVLIGLAGLSWLTGYLDYGLTPLLGFFISALTLTLYSHYENKYIAYVGSVALLGFVALYFIWGVVLGILVIVGALIAMLAYLPLSKKLCKKCLVKK